MVRLQSWSFGECGISLHCYNSHIPFRVPFMGQTAFEWPSSCILTPSELELDICRKGIDFLHGAHWLCSYSLTLLLGFSNILHKQMKYFLSEEKGWLNMEYGNLLQKFCFKNFSTQSVCCALQFKEKRIVSGRE